MTHVADASTRRSYTVPTHINEPDKLLFGLTARQLLILITGASLAYAFFLQVLTWVIPLGAGLLWSRGLALLVVLPLIVGTPAFTFLQIADRSLELWVVVWVRAHLAPITYVWHSAKWDEVEQRGHSTRQNEHVQHVGEEEGWS